MAASAQDFQTPTRWWCGGHRRKNHLLQVSVDYNPRMAQCGGEGSSIVGHTPSSRCSRRRCGRAPYSKRPFSGLAGRNNRPAAGVLRNVQLFRKDANNLVRVRQPAGRPAELKPIETVARRRDASQGEHSLGAFFRENIIYFNWLPAALSASVRTHLHVSMGGARGAARMGCRRGRIIHLKCLQWCTKSDKQQEI